MLFLSGKVQRGDLAFKSNMNAKTNTLVTGSLSKNDEQFDFQLNTSEMPWENESFRVNLLKLAQGAGTHRSGGEAIFPAGTVNSADFADSVINMKAGRGGYRVTDGDRSEGSKLWKQMEATPTASLNFAKKLGAEKLTLDLCIAYKHNVRVKSEEAKKAAAEEAARLEAAELRAMTAE